MHDPDGPTPKPASTWGNTTGVALHNIYYRTPAWHPGISLQGERSGEQGRRSQPVVDPTPPALPSLPLLPRRRGGQGIV